MDLKTAAKNLLQQHNLKALKSRSQNFLVSESAYQQIIESAELSTTDTVLEIGPGLGFLTTRLLEKAGEVWSIEIDNKLADLLRPLQTAYKNFYLEKGDILKFDQSRLPENYKLVANIPYHLSGRIISKFISGNSQPALAVILVQKEVGERICASAGRHSLLSLAVQYYGRPEIIDLVPAENFYPPPKVDSVILKVSGIKSPANKEQERNFWRLVKYGFSSKRKTLAHNLAAGLHLPKTEMRTILQRLGFSKTVRAQEISVDQWGKIIGFLSSYEKSDQ